MLFVTARLHDARFLTFAGVVHDVHIEAPDRLAEAIEAFVRDTPASD